MKKICFSVICCLITTAMLSAQQDMGFYYFRKGCIAEKTIYDSKNGVIARQDYKGLSLNRQDDGIAASGLTVQFKGGKETESYTGLFTYNEPVLLISVGNTADGTTVFLDYPADPDKRLVTDVVFETESKRVGMQIKANCTIVNRRVLSPDETVTSVLNTWHSIKTGYDMIIKAKAFGINITINVSVIEWFVPGFGIVKTEIYRGGKLQERRLLTKLNCGGVIDN